MSADILYIEQQIPSYKLKERSKSRGSKQDLKGDPSTANQCLLPSNPGQNDTCKAVILWEQKAKLGLCSLL